MAFAPQQYDNIYNDNRHANDNGHIYDTENTNMNNGDMQFAIYANNKELNQSLPNLHMHPLGAHSQESVPYHSEAEPHNSSQPKLTSNIKSIELNTNHSTPDSIQEHNDSQYETESILLQKESHSIFVNADQTLLNQQSVRIEDEQQAPIHETESSHSSGRNMPITQFTNNKIYEYDHKTQRYYRQRKISNDSYDDTFNTGLYPTVSELHETDNIHIPHTALPNATSIALDEKYSTNDNEVKPSKRRRKLSLSKHFSNDIKAYETWMSSCDIEDDTFGYYSALYPLLCEIFAESTRCSRVPKQCDLEEVLLAHGASKIKISEFMEMNELSGTINGDIMSIMNKDSDGITPPDTPTNNANRKHMATVSAQYSGTISFDFDNPLSKPQYLVTIKYKSFLKFWRWFLECCKIIKELAHLWEANHQSAFQCNLFCGREESHEILDQAPQGTFMLRLSSIIKGGIVLSYVEPSYSKKDKRFKHTILIRRKSNQYELRSHARKRQNSKGQKAQKLTTISTLIRSFVKIKFLYTPKNLYPKKSVF